MVLTAATREGLEKHDNLFAFSSVNNPCRRDGLTSEPDADPTVGPEHIRTQNGAIADGDWHVLLQQNTVWRGGDFDIRSHKIADAASCPAERLCYGRDVHCPSFVTFRLVAGEFNS